MKLFSWLILTKTIYNVSAFDGICTTQRFVKHAMKNHQHQNHCTTIRLFSSLNDNGMNEMKTSTSSTICDIPTNGFFPATDFVSTKNSGQLFRSLKLTDVNGQLIQLGDKMPVSKPSVVVFLRHLG
jgi:hypothetical protein